VSFLAGASRSETLREIGLRVTLALFPCAVLALHLRPVLGVRPGLWLVPLVMGFGNAFLVVSVGRQLLRGRRFLVFWALYGLIWAGVAWHGTHFHRAPRPAALFMNLGEISEVPWPGWEEVPWVIVLVALGLGWLARRPVPIGRETRLATAGAVGLCALLQGYAVLHYQTRDMVRFSQYRDLVRTHGLEAAVILDGLQTFRLGRGASALAVLRRDKQDNPATSLPVDPVRVDRMVVVQVESLDREALTPAIAPALTAVWQTTTRGLVVSQRSSVSGSSSADFQLLTGLRPLSGIPVYRLAWDGSPETFPGRASARGFRFHAYHGNDPNFWNRGPFLAAIGVDFQTSESIPETEHSRWGRTDGDLLRYVAGRVHEQRAVHFVITLSTHPPFDLVRPPGPMDDVRMKERYLASMRYADDALGKFVGDLPRDGNTLLVLYGDHPSGVFEPPGSEEPPVPMMLGVLTPDGRVTPLTRAGRPVQDLPGTYELPGLHQFLLSCLDASAR